jgi:hypothetical protein
MAIQQFIVPQFIDVEDKIIGFVTIRQFTIMMVALVIGAVEYKILAFPFFLVFGIITVGVGAILAFARVNGRPVHFFLLNFVQTMKRPAIRVWNKASYVLGMHEVKSVIQETAHAAGRRGITGSRLQDLALIVNTGGVYRTEEDIFDDNIPAD